MRGEEGGEGGRCLWGSRVSTQYVLPALTHFLLTNQCIQ